MAPVVVSSNTFLSEVTLAMFEDLGWSVLCTPNRNPRSPQNDPLLNRGLRTCA